MNKLQKIFESKILFNIGNVVSGHKLKLTAWMWIRSKQKNLRKTFSKIEKAIEWLWEEAEKHYPNAKCFKEEGASK